MKIKDATFTVFDVETTGLSPFSGDKICEIAALKFGPDGQEEFQSLVNPKRPISPGAYFVNRITPDMLRGAPTMSKVMPKFMKFIKGTVLVAYNAGFDLGFIESELAGKKSALNRFYVIDALTLARELFPGLGRYNLGNVARALGITVEQEHRAMADVRMTLEVFKKELELLFKNRVTSVKGIAKRAPKKTVRLKKVKDYRVEIIEKAIKEQKKLNIAYRSKWSDAKTERVVTPRKLESGYDKGYLIAYCHMRKADRVFLVEGIESIEVRES